MKACALLVNYRNAPDIAQAVASVMQDDPTSDIVVVDNSDDEREWEHLNALLPTNIRLLCAAGNLGFGSGCNLGMAYTSAEFIFLVNPDVRLLPGCTQALLQCMKENERLAAVSPMQFLDSDCQWKLPPSWLPTRIRAWASERALHEPRIAARLSAAYAAENLRFWTARGVNFQRALSGAAMMVRRSALLAGEPLFDPRYFMYFEDTDLCMRLRQRNWRLASVPCARAVHAWRNQPHKQGMMVKSAALYFDKFFPTTTSWAARRTTVSAMEGVSTQHYRVFPPNGFRLPSNWSDDWIMELSPSPLINPAIALSGHGRDIAEPTDALAHFESAAVYGRVTSVSHPYDSTHSILFAWPARAPA